jgi:hypothetical protein
MAGFSGPGPGYGQSLPSAAVPQPNPVVVTSETIDLRKTGLRLSKPGKFYQGYILYNHLTMKTMGSPFVTPIFLIDREGNIVYQWTVDTSASFARLAPDGQLFYATNDWPTAGVYDPGKSGLRKLDLQSNVLWFYPAFIQHDFQLLDNGNILLERYENMQPTPRSPPILIQRIEVVSPKDKKVLWRWKTEDHVQELEQLIGIKIDTISASLDLGYGHWARMNSCQLLADSPLAKADARFKPGNIFICFPHTNILGIIAYPSGRVVWAWGPGILDGPHQPASLPNGDILLFDNGEKRGWSRVIEIDPIKREIVWEYHSTPKETFYAPFLSGAERLPNGNIFVCDGTHSRFFEITPGGEIVWDFISTYDRIDTEAILRANMYAPQYVQPVLRAAADLQKGLQGGPAPN